MKCNFNNVASFYDRVIMASCTVIFQLDTGHAEYTQKVEIFILSEEAYAKIFWAESL